MEPTLPLAAAPVAVTEGFSITAMTASLTPACLSATNPSVDTSNRVFDRRILAMITPSEIFAFASRITSRSVIAAAAGFGAAGLPWPAVPPDAPETCGDAVCPREICGTMAKHAANNPQQRIFLIGFPQLLITVHQDLAVPNSPHILPTSANGRKAHSCIVATVVSMM